MHAFFAQLVAQGDAGIHFHTNDVDHQGVGNAFPAALQFVGHQVFEIFAHRVFPVAVWKTNGSSPPVVSLIMRIGPVGITTKCFQAAKRRDARLDS